MSVRVGGGAQAVEVEIGVAREGTVRLESKAKELSVFVDGWTVGASGVDTVIRKFVLDDANTSGNVVELRHGVEERAAQEDVLVGVKGVDDQAEHSKGHVANRRERQT